MGQLTPFMGETLPIYEILSKFLFLNEQTEDSYAKLEQRQFLFDEELVMLFTASVIAFGCGILCYIDSDFIWTLLEADARLMGTHIQRPLHWESQVAKYGAVLLFAGGLGILLGLGIIGF